MTLYLCKNMKKILSTTILLVSILSAYAKAAVEFQNLTEVTVNNDTEIIMSIPSGWSAGDLLIAYITKDDNRDGWKSISRFAGENYNGIVFDDASSGDICRIDWYFGLTGGDPTANDYYVEIWLLDGALDFDTLQGRSAKVDGSGWGGAMVTFTFPYRPLTSFLRPETS